MKITTHDNCRACGTKLPDSILLNMGEQAIVDFPLPGEKSRGKAPLVLVKCEKCELVQLRHSVDQDTLFSKFWYRSSINEQMREALKDIVKCAMERVELKKDDRVVDIGANDGELLSNYSDTLIRVGFEPARELAQEAAYRMPSRTAIYADYFREGYLYPDSCKIITAIAMFYDLDNPAEFLKEVVKALHPDGIFVVQMNYLGLMLKNLTFDNISHEHACYYSLHSLERLFHSCGLVITEIVENDVNGGSVRIYATKNIDARPTPSVEWEMAVDTRMCSEYALQNFCDRVRALGSIILSFLQGLKSAGKKVYVYGASTRGLALLQTVFGNIKATDYIIGAAERDKNKLGRVMAGLGIPIVSEEEAREKADYFLLLPYHFWSSISKREWKWMLSGGKFIIPLPFPRVIAMGEVGGSKIPIASALEEDLQAVKS